MPWHPCPETVCLFTLFCLTCQKVVRKRSEIGQLRFPCWAGPRLFSIFGPSVIPGLYCLSSRRRLNLIVGAQVLFLGVWVFVCLFILLECASRREKPQWWVAAGRQFRSNGNELEDPSRHRVQLNKELCVERSALPMLTPLWFLRQRSCDERRESVMQRACCKLYLLPALVPSPKHETQTLKGSKTLTAPRALPVATRNTAPIGKSKRTKNEREKRKKQHSEFPVAVSLADTLKNPPPTTFKMQSKRTMKMDFFFSCHCRNV